MSMCVDSSAGYCYCQPEEGDFCLHNAEVAELQMQVEKSKTTEDCNACDGSGFQSAGGDVIGTWPCPFCIDGKVISVDKVFSQHNIPMPQTRDYAEKMLMVSVKWLQDRGEKIRVVRDDTD